VQRPFKKSDFCKETPHVKKEVEIMIDLLRTRRSIRAYTKTFIDPALIETLKEALLRSPSSRGINPWEFVFVDDPAILEKLSRAKQHGSQFLKDTKLGIVMCGDETKSDVWIEDCAIASILVQMTTHSLGLGSCWIQIRLRNHDKTTTSEQYVQQLLGIPEKIRVAAIIGIGHPNEIKMPHSANTLDYGKIRKNGWKI
jgi:nitroreductase